MDSDKDQVNYFEHDFNQLDLHSTWKVATKQKDQVNNGRRVRTFIISLTLTINSWKTQAGEGSFKNNSNYLL